MATRKRTTKSKVSNAAWLMVLGLSLQELLGGLVAEPAEDTDLPKAFFRLVEFGASVRDIAAATGMSRDHIVAQLMSLAHMKLTVGPVR